MALKMGALGRPFFLHGPHWVNIAAVTIRRILRVLLLSLLTLAIPIQGSFALGVLQCDALEHGDPDAAAPPEQAKAAEQTGTDGSCSQPSGWCCPAVASAFSRCSFDGVRALHASLPLAVRPEPLDRPPAS